MESITAFYRNNDTLTIEVTCIVNLDENFQPDGYEVTEFRVTNDDGEQWEYFGDAAQLHWDRMVIDEPCVVEELEAHHEFDADNYEGDF